MWIKTTKTDAVNSNSYRSFYVKDGICWGMVERQLDRYGECEKLYTAPADKPEFARVIFDVIMFGLQSGAPFISILEYVDEKPEAE